MYQLSLGLLLLHLETLVWMLGTGIELVCLTVANSHLRGVPYTAIIQFFKPQTLS